MDCQEAETRHRKEPCLAYQRENPGPRSHLVRLCPLGLLDRYPRCLRDHQDFLHRNRPVVQVRLRRKVRGVKQI